MKNNKYIGPDAAKTWKRLTMKNPAVELDQPETDATHSDDRSVFDDGHVKSETDRTHRSVF